MSQYQGKKVLIVGFGLTGVAVAKYMVQKGAQVTVTDSKPQSALTESIQACAGLPLEYEFGKHHPKTFLAANLIVVSPGVSLKIKGLEEAREKQIPMTNEIELAAAEIREPIIAVTGTNGKTTTTSLIGDMIKAAGKEAFIGGNIGQPLLNYILNKKKADFLVVELSSFQLELCEKLTPAVALWTNVDADHLDRYENIQAYIQAKKKLLTRCIQKSFVVLNYDDPVLLSLKDDHLGKLLWFTKKNPITISPSFSKHFSGVYFDHHTKTIFSKLMGNEESYDLSAFKLFGDHNKENLMAAICAARVCGIEPWAIQKVIQECKALPHRLEFVRKKGGVFFFNDSKGTNVMSVQKSLSAFQSNSIILIAGGKDKDSNFTTLLPTVNAKCKLLILLGEAKEKMNRSLGDCIETYLVGTFEEAVLLAYQKSRSGDIILLSPGCASYDMFRNYEERGNYFKKLVTQL